MTFDRDIAEAAGPMLVIGRRVGTERGHLERERAAKAGRDAQELWQRERAAEAREIDLLWLDTIGGE